MRTAVVSILLELAVACLPLVSIVSWSLTRTSMREEVITPYLQGTPKNVAGPTYRKNEKLPQKGFIPVSQSSNTPSNVFYLLSQACSTCGLLTKCSPRSKPMWPAILNIWQLAQPPSGAFRSTECMLVLHNPGSCHTVHKLQPPSSALLQFSQVNYI